MGIPSKIINKGFIWACSYNKLNIVRFFVEKIGVDIHQYDNYQGFIIACRKGYLEIVKYFYLRYVCEFKSKKIYCGFRWACSRGHLNIVRYFVEQCEYIDSELESGFKWACCNGYVKIVRYLYSSEKFKDIDIHSSPYSWDWDFEIACQKGHLNVVKYLIEVVKIDLIKEYQRIIKSWLLHYDIRYRCIHKANLIKFLHIRKTKYLEFVNDELNKKFPQDIVNNCLMPYLVS